MNATLDAVTLSYATLSEVHEAARTNLEPAVLDFLEGGAGEETTLRRNRAAFSRWALKPRVMSGRDLPSLATTFMGVDLSLPVLTACFGADRLFHPEGQVAVARANAAAGTASIAPEAGSFSVEEIAAAAPTAAAFGQLHPLGTDATFLRMVRRFESAGYRALVLTCDCPTAGWRERNLRNRFMPADDIVGGNYPPDEAEDMHLAFGQLFTQHQAVWSWERLGALMAGTHLPWIAKGILTPEDAEAALAAGASALLVSNHGGRQLDDVVASLDALPAIRAAVGPDVEIAFDSGIRRGSDIVKALALGADVVVLGRLAVYGLAAAGQPGVERVMELLAEEMTTVLTLLGRGGVTEIDAAALLRVQEP